LATGLLASPAAGVLAALAPGMRQRARRRQLQSPPRLWPPTDATLRARPRRRRRRLSRLPWLALLRRGEAPGEDEEDAQEDAAGVADGAAPGEEKRTQRVSARTEKGC